MSIFVNFDRERAEKQRVPDNVFPRRNEDRRPTSWPTEEVISGPPTGARAGSGPGAGPRANQMPAVPQSYLGFAIHCILFDS